MTSGGLKHHTNEMNKGEMLLTVGLLAENARLRVVHSVEAICSEEISQLTFVTYCGAEPSRRGDYRRLIYSF